MCLYSAQTVEKNQHMIGMQTIFLLIFVILQTLKKECRNEILNNCTCILDHVIRVGNSLRPMITVNCTQQNFVTLPTNLPNFTSTLIMRSNMVGINNKH